MLPGDVFYTLGNAPKSFFAEALPGTPLGELTALPMSLAGEEGTGRHLPKNPIPALAIRASRELRPYGPRCLVPKHRRKYILVTAWYSLVCDADARASMKCTTTAQRHRGGDDVIMTSSGPLRAPVRRPNSLAEWQDVSATGHRLPLSASSRPRARLQLALPCFVLAVVITFCCDQRLK